MADIEMAQGEGKWVRFTVTSNGAAVDLTDKECTLRFASNYGESAYALEKVDADFDKTQGASGIARINITSGETTALEPDTYKGNLRIVISGEAGEDVDVNRAIDLKIRDSFF
jgi:hypothetical protein